MSDITIHNPAPIVVQVKGGKTTAISSPTGSATKLVELSDVVTANLSDGKVLTYVGANGAFEFQAQASASATDQVARDIANAAFGQANAAYANANTAIYTAAQIRANVSNTTPINYSPTTGVISHADSGVAPTTYGNTTFVPTITVDAKGHVTAITNTAIALPPSTDEFARAQANAAYNQANSATIIATSAYSQANVATTNADASFARANAAFNQANTANVTGQAAFDKANTAIYTAAQIRANVSNTAPINYDPSTGIISHAVSGVTASGYGDAATVAKVVVDSNGHVTSVTNTSIAISTAQITSGILPVARGGTGQTAITVNGSLLIANTVSGGFDVNPLTQGTGIVITNDKGSITIAATGGSAIDQYARDKANGAAQNAFITINVAGQNNVIASSNVATLKLIAGNNMTIITDNVNSSITFSSTGGSSNGSANVPLIEWDDFISGGYTAFTSIVGKLGWTLNPDGTGASGAQNENGHPGIIALTTGGTTGSRSWMYMPSDGGNPGFLKFHDHWEVKFIVKFTKFDANGTMLAPAVVVTNGVMLIGNTVSGGFDTAVLTQGAGTTITNSKGSITISANTQGISYAMLNGFAMP